MALKITNKNKPKPSVVESKIELKHAVEEKQIKDEKYYNDEYIDTKINYKLFFGFLLGFSIVAFFVI